MVKWNGLVLINELIIAILFTCSVRIAQAVCLCVCGLTRPAPHSLVCVSSLSCCHNCLFSSPGVECFGFATPVAARAQTPKIASSSQINRKYNNLLSLANCVAPLSWSPPCSHHTLNKQTSRFLSASVGNRVGRPK